MAQAIPKAQAPEGKNFLYHLQAPNDNLLTYFEDIAQQGDIVQLGFLPAYLVNHPDYVQEVLVKQAKSFHKPNSVKHTVAQFLGTQNLFSSDDAVWRALRKAEQPAFHMRRIGSYLSMMAEQTYTMLGSWQSGQTLDFPQVMMDLTLSITSMSLFGQDIANAKAGEAIIEFLDLFSDRITTPVPIPAWLPLSSNQRMKEALKVADELLLPIIEERKASGEDTGDILSMLLLAQQNDDTGILTDLQVRNEVYNLFAAGYEVTANTTAFTMYLIATHSTIYHQLIAEIDNVLADGQLTLDKVGQLTYLEQVIKESMRLLPITAVVSRTATEDIRIGDYRIPKNAQVFVAPWALHRRADIYPNPEQFDPNRFMPENEKDIPKNAYIPFSTGPRVCLGSAFAMLQMKTTLSLMLKQYQFNVADDYIFEPYWRFNTRLKHGLPLTIQAR
ncbi:MAG: cytochrome P450 [Chloroflexota bacterium]